jgi:hypothetical protein
MAYCYVFCVVSDQRNFGVSLLQATHLANGILWNEGNAGEREIHVLTAAIFS